MIDIRPATAADEPAIWRILEPVIRAGETYMLPPDLGAEAALRYWCQPAHRVFVAASEGVIVGTYYLRANQQGGGDHVANCGYVTDQAARGRGVARTMCLHSQDEAKRAGFSAMQFNAVVATNERAVRLWRSLGFAVVGTLPGAFRHPTAGLVDAHVMYRRL